MKENILLINICKEKLHYNEFVMPIGKILTENKLNYFVKNYSDLTNNDLAKSSRVIICGTSLKDNSFLEPLHLFNWINDFNKPILGICAGMQIIGLIFKGKLKKKTEIGFFFEDFTKEFLGIQGRKEVYHLHNNYLEFSKEFDKFTANKISQAVKHREKEVYGCLFHPEVRQEELVLNFCKIKKIK